MAKLGAYETVVPVTCKKAPAALVAPGLRGNVTAREAAKPSESVAGRRSVLIVLGPMSAVADGEDTEVVGRLWNFACRGVRG